MGKLTKNDLKWCQSHDWGTEAILNMSGHIFIYDNHAEKMVKFSNMRELRIWAGY